MLKPKPRENCLLFTFGGDCEACIALSFSEVSGEASYLISSENSSSMLRSALQLYL